MIFFRANGQASPQVSPPPYPFSFIFLHTESKVLHSLFYHCIPPSTPYLCIPANLELFTNHTKTKVAVQEAMAASTATISQAAIITAAIAGSGKTSPKKTKVNYLSGLNSFGGLKAQNNVVSLGLPVSTEHSFAKIVSSLNYPSQSKGRGGGALSSTCNAIAEIFRIAAIINGLTLIGVAMGFVLLRIEATVEESE